MTPDLQRLLAESTPGRWMDAGPSRNGHLVTFSTGPEGGYNIVARAFAPAREADAALIALTPEITDYAIRANACIEKAPCQCERVAGRYGACWRCALLAAFDRIGGEA